MDGLPINVTDLAIAAVILIFGAYAFMRGFVHMILAMAAWVGAAVATVLGLPYVLPYSRELISIKIIADIVGGVALFILVLILLSILTHWLSRRVRESSLGAVDRSLGLLFGLAAGAVLVCVLWIGLIWAIPRQDHPVWISEARALPLVEQGAEVILEALPEGLRPNLAPGNVGTQPAAAPSVEQLSRPEVAADPPASGEEAGPPAPTGYKDDERKDLQRLIDSAQ